VLFTLIGPPAVCFLTTASTYLSRHTPDHLLGRANSAYGMVQAGATLVGMIAGAVLGQQLGIHVTVNLAAFTIALGGVAVLSMPSAQARRRPAGH
jgi:MFS family permease